MLLICVLKLNRADEFAAKKLKNVQINEEVLYSWSKVLSVIFYCQNIKYLFLWLKICCVLYLHRMLLAPSITPTIIRNALYFDGNDIPVYQFTVLSNSDLSPFSSHRLEIEPQCSDL